MKTNIHNKLLEAIKILELENPVSYNDVKHQYKKLLKKYHPDKCQKNKKECEQKTREIIEATKILLSYIENYKVYFNSQEDSLHNSIEEWWFQRFGENYFSNKE
ncbi:MAG TPA: J domain-containing protein [bacterium]|nr:J domain-containing protein [bacterium]HOL47473.1 J domain-containing protein [bacterium]HPQ18618.1 J domain-containing protein [bacterium]